MIWMTIRSLVRTFNLRSMERVVRLTVLMSIIAALFCSCSIEQEYECDSVSLSKNKVIIEASYPELTKVSVSEGESALDLAWNESDFLTVVCGDLSERYDLVSYSGNVAKFCGYPIEGESYDIILSCTADECLSRSYEGQVQATVASVDHLKYDAVLKGVSQYKEVTFTNEWAEAHGGELLQNGCLLLYFQMPDDAGHLRRVTLTAPSEIFYVTNSADGGKTDAITLSFDDADMSADNVVKAHIMTSMQEAQIPADAKLTLTVVSNLGIWTKEFTPGTSVIGAGKRSVIKLNSENWSVPNGDGTEANPYILRTAADLKNMSSKLGAELKYVAMVADIDAASITEWPSISYTKLLDFNGNNRTISNFKPTTFKNDYAGFVGILNGRIANLNIKGAEITGNTDKASGILCGYLGRNNASAFGEIENVHVEGSISGTGKGVGGLVGIIGSGKISRSSANVNVHGTKDDVGGLVGYYRDGSTDNVCEISNCWTSGTVIGDTQKVGGIMGETYGNADEVENINAVLIENCYSTASVQGVRNVAGIVAYTVDKEPTSVQNCIAWNESIEATGTKLTQHSSGAVVGKTYVLHTLYDCYRKPEIIFNCIIYDKNGEYRVIDATVCNQDNADASNKLVVGTYGDADSEYKTNGCSNWYPYHGKAAKSTSTLSAVARAIKWDESIWDLSGEMPVLIR